MKLRQHKREHVKRLRRRIWHRRADELLKQFHQASADMADALTNFILAPGRMVREMVRRTIAPIAQAVAAAGGFLPGSSVGGVVHGKNPCVWINGQPSVLTSAVVDLRDTNPPVTLLPDGTRIEAGANGTPVVHVDGSKVSAAALIAMADMVPSSTSGTLEVAMTAEQRQRAMRAMERVLRDDPRRFTFHPKLPRR